MTEATTKECRECAGHGLVVHSPSTGTERCAACNGTGVVLGTLDPEPPDPTRRVCGECGAEIDARFGDCAVFGVHTLQFVESGIGATGATKTCEACGGTGRMPSSTQVAPCPICNGSGIETTGVICGACGRPDRVLTAALTDRDATIAALRKELDDLTTELGRASEAASESDKLYDYGADRDSEIAALRIERDDLLARVETLSEAWQKGEVLSTEARRALQSQHNEIVTERDVLRLEVQRLKDERFEAMDRYAALEAERDHLRTELDGWVGGTNQAMRALGEQAARADAYLAVIDKQAAMISAIQQHEITALEMCVAFAQANLPSPVRLPKEAKCEKSDERS